MALSSSHKLHSVSYYLHYGHIIIFITEEKISISLILFEDKIFLPVLFFDGVEVFIISTFLSEAVPKSSTLLATLLFIFTSLFISKLFTYTPFTSLFTSECAFFIYAKSFPCLGLTVRFLTRFLVFCLETSQRDTSCNLCFFNDLLTFLDVPNIYVFLKQLSTQSTGH